MNGQDPVAKYKQSAREAGLNVGGEDPEDPVARYKKSRDEYYSRRGALEVRPDQRGTLRDLPGVIADQYLGGRHFAANAVSRLVAGARGLTNALLPGQPGDAIFTPEMQEGARRLFGEPETGLEKLQATAGAFAGEAGQYMAGGGLVRKGLTAVAPKLGAAGARVAEIAARPKKRIDKFAQDVAFGAPVDVAIASSGPEESMLYAGSQIAQMAGKDELAQNLREGSEETGTRVASELLFGMGIPALVHGGLGARDVARAVRRGPVPMEQQLADAGVVTPQAMSRRVEDAKAKAQRDAVADADAAIEEFHRETGTRMQSQMVPPRTPSEGARIRPALPPGEYEVPSPQGVIQQNYEQVRQRAAQDRLRSLGNQPIEDAEVVPPRETPQPEPVAAAPEPAPAPAAPAAPEPPSVGKIGTRQNPVTLPGGQVAYRTNTNWFVRGQNGKFSMVKNPTIKNALDEAAQQEGLTGAKKAPEPTPVQTPEAPPAPRQMSWWEEKVSAVEELDKRNAPDSEYRGLLSTGSKGPENAREAKVAPMGRPFAGAAPYRSWREKVLEWADRARAKEEGLEEEYNLFLQEAYAPKAAAQTPTRATKRQALQAPEPAPAPPAQPAPNDAIEAAYQAGHLYRKKDGTYVPLDDEGKAVLAGRAPAAVPEAPVPPAAPAPPRRKRRTKAEIDAEKERHFRQIGEGMRMLREGGGGMQKVAGTDLKVGDDVETSLGVGKLVKVEDGMATVRTDLGMSRVELSSLKKAEPATPKAPEPEVKPRDAEETEWLIEHARSWLHTGAPISADQVDEIADDWVNFVRQKAAEDPETLNRGYSRTWDEFAASRSDDPFAPGKPVKVKGKRVAGTILREVEPQLRGKKKQRMVKVRTKAGQEKNYFIDELEPEQGGFVSRQLAETAGESAAGAVAGSIIGAQADDESPGRGALIGAAAGAVGLPAARRFAFPTRPPTVEEAARSAPPGQLTRDERVLLNLDEFKGTPTDRDIDMLIEGRLGDVVPEPGRVPREEDTLDRVRRVLNEVVKDYNRKGVDAARATAERYMDPQHADSLLREIEANHGQLMDQPGPSAANDIVSRYAGVVRNLDQEINRALEGPAPKEPSSDQVLKQDKVPPTPIENLGSDITRRMGLVRELLDKFPDDDEFFRQFHERYRATSPSLDYVVKWDRALREVLLERPDRFEGVRRAERNFLLGGHATPPTPTRPLTPQEIENLRNRGEVLADQLMSGNLDEVAERNAREQLKRIQERLLDDEINRAMSGPAPEEPPLGGISRSIRDIYDRPSLIREYDSLDEAIRPGGYLENEFDAVMEVNRILEPYYSALTAGGRELHRLDDVTRRRLQTAFIKADDAGKDMILDQLGDIASIARERGAPGAQSFSQFQVFLDKNRNRWGFVDESLLRRMAGPLGEAFFATLFTAKGLNEKDENRAAGYLMLGMAFGGLGAHRVFGKQVARPGTFLWNRMVGGKDKFASYLWEKSPTLGNFFFTGHTLGDKFQELKRIRSHEIAEGQRVASEIVNAIASLERTAGDPRIDALMSKAVDEGVQGEDLTRFLLDNGLKPEVAREVAGAVNDLHSIFSELGERMVKAELLRPGTVQKYAKKYLPKLYEETEGFIQSRFHGNRTPVRLRGQERTMLRKGTDKLTPVESAKYRAAVGVIQESYLAATEEFFRAIKANDEWTHSGYRQLHTEYRDLLKLKKNNIRARRAYEAGDNATRKELRRLEKEGARLDQMIRDKRFEMKREGAKAQAAGFQQLPNPKNLGSLRGLYVRSDVFNEIQGFARQKELYGQIVDGYEKGLRMWKTGKTALNPATHGRNMFGAQILGWLGDGPIPFGADYWQSFDAIAKNGRVGNKRMQRMYRLARDHGVLDASYQSSVTEQLGRTFDDPASVGIKEAKRLRGMGSKAARPLRKMIRAYGMEDQAARMYYFIDAVERRGMKPAEAAKLSKEWVPDYANLSNFTRTWAKFGAPFFAYTARAVPRVAESALKNPLRFLAIGTIAYAFGKLKFEQDVPQEVLPPEMRGVFDRGPIGAAAPKWMRNAARFALPTYVPFARDDEQGRRPYLDMTYILPYGDLAEGRGRDYGPLSWLPQQFDPTANPLLSTAAALSMNKDPFTGREIVSRSYSGMDKLKATTDYVWKEAAPSLAPELPFGLSEGGWGYQKLKDAALQRPNWYDEVKPRGRALADAVFGFKQREVVPVREFRRRVNDMRRTVDDLEMRIRTTMRDPAIDPAEKERMVRDMKEQRARMVAEFQRLVALRDRVPGLQQ